MITKENIKERLSECIKDSGVSQKELAKALNLSRSTISKYLHKKCLPSLEILAKLCKVLNLNTNYVFCLDKNDTTKQIQIKTNNFTGDKNGKWD